MLVRVIATLCFSGVKHSAPQYPRSYQTFQTCFWLLHLWAEFCCSLLFLSCGP
ncbi:hypothetical protein BDV29DRAFT_184671 [Aspergillus leporis]|uniref:Uncharacterized protein n=1 Tax=Aspergillus leporis TaxID=41062 RepID=A0A5N5WMV5_9EURO|nr:hypothetical protein BDV29DRAFT_184671 [Aspergillus leporis]